MIATRSDISVSSTRYDGQDVARAGRFWRDNTPSPAQRANVVAGKSVGGEDDPAEPSIYQRRAAGSLGGRAAQLQRYHNL
jgi:hypothetical protein